MEEEEEEVGVEEEEEVGGFAEFRNANVVVVGALARSVTDEAIFVCSTLFFYRRGGLDELCL